jgi:hypothetical protein
MNAVAGLLDRAVDGHGAVVGIVGSPVVLRTEVRGGVTDG